MIAMNQRAAIPLFQKRVPLLRRAIRLGILVFITNVTAFNFTPNFAPNFAQANIVGTDAQNFNPTTSGLDFVTVQSSETLKPGIFNLGLFLNYAVNSLPYLENANGSRTQFTDRLTSVDFNAGVGLGKDWDFGVSLPHVAKQQVDDGTTSRGEFAATGLTEVRLNSKYRFAGDDAGGYAAIVSVGFNQIENNPFVGKNGGPNVNLELAADTTIERWAIGGNIGYRLRNKGEKLAGSIATPLGAQMIASAAASYFIPAYSVKLITEIFGALPAESSTAFGERTQTSFEWLVGMKHDLTTNLAVHAGGGTEIIQGYGSPDWRLYAGLNYSFGPETEPQPAESRYLEVVPHPLETAKTIERFRTQAILFEFDSDKMVGNNDLVLKELADGLKRGFRSLLVEGHTDSVGAANYNLALSLKRAIAIRRRLIDRFGLPGEKIKAEGLGESRPIADNGNYQGRQTNRRVEFVVNFE